MLFISAEDFFTQAKTISPLTREAEIALAREMPQNAAARERLIRSYFPMAANYLRRLPRELQTLQAVYTCLASLEKGVDSFHFLQEGERFSHHLAWRLRQCITRILADR